MSLQSINPTTRKAWQALQNHFHEIENVTMQEMFQDDKLRTQNFHIQWDKFLLDYSKNRINQKTINLLLDLANEVGLKEGINSYFSGDIINKTENRAVLHTALRANHNNTVLVDGENVIPEIF